VADPTIEAVESYHHSSLEHFTDVFGQETRLHIIREMLSHINSDPLHKSRHTVQCQNTPPAQEAIAWRTTFRGYSRHALLECDAASRPLCYFAWCGKESGKVILF
jgi:hypothetical protein